MMHDIGDLQLHSWRVQGVEPVDGGSSDDAAVSVRISPGIDS